MKCPAENILRAYNDSELESAPGSEIEQHLERCSQCRGRLAKISALTRRVNSQLESLDRPAAASPVAENSAAQNIDARRALSHFRARLSGHETRAPLIARLFAARWRP